MSDTNNILIVSAGAATAYGSALEGGYTGTYEDFCRQQASYAGNAAAVEAAKTAAQTAANTATTKAGEATTAATAAQTAKTQTEAAASQALTDIGAARTSAVNAVQTEGATQTANARAQAQAAETSATTASTKASEASASATTATTKATEAAASATSAAQSASDAQDVLDSIPADYSEMSADVEQLKADLVDLQEGGYIADAQQIQTKISAWLAEHPEATTTVQDGSLAESKFSNALKLKTIKDYVTPQMFGAKGDGVTDDTDAIQDALDYAENNSANTIVFPKGVYLVSPRPNATSIFASKFVSLIGLKGAVIKTTVTDDTIDLFTFTNFSKASGGEVSGLTFRFGNDDYTSIRYVFNFLFNDSNNPLMYNLRMENNVFWKNASYKLFATGASAGCFNNCSFSHNIVYGLFLKCGNWGDSNRINCNSLFGAGNIQLNNFVIDLEQQTGSAGNEICGNNCSAGLGRFTSFIRARFASNQIENVAQTWSGFYNLSIVNGNNIVIEACNISSNVGKDALYCNSLATVIIECGISSTSQDGKLITRTVTADALKIIGCRGQWGNTIYNGIFPAESHSGNGKITSVVTSNHSGIDGGKSFVDSNLIAHIFAEDTNTHTLTPFAVKGAANGVSVTGIDGTVLNFISASGFKFTTVPTMPILIDTTELY